MKWNYKINNTLLERKEESEKIKDLYPDRIPLIVQKVPNSAIPELDKSKFLITKDVTVAQFVYIIRKRIQLDPEMAIFIFIERFMPSASETMSTLFDKYVDEDGFLYVAYGGESSFG